jgi:hypothetical protein
MTLVDTRFSDQTLGSRIAAVFGSPVHIDVQPIALRSIFTTMARAMREGKS